MNYNAKQNRERLAYINKTTSEDMKTDPRVKELAEAALKSCTEIMETFKKQGLLFKTEDKNGNERTAALVVKVTPRVDKSAEPTKIKVNGKIQESYPELTDKDGNTVYSVTGNITAKDGSSLSTAFSNKINEDGKVNAVSVYYSKFADRKRVEGAKGIDEINKSKAPDEIKAFANGLDKNDILKRYSNSKLSDLAVHLNKDVFKTKIMVEVEEDGKKKDVEKKLVSASYNNDEQYGGEHVTIFNKSEDANDRAVTVKLYEKDGEIAVFAINSALTFDEDAKMAVPKSKEDDKSISKRINDAYDIVNFLPEIDELKMGVAEVTGVDWEEVKEAAKEIAEAGNNEVEDEAEAEEGVNDFEEVEGVEIDDLPF